MEIKPIRVKISYEVRPGIEVEIHGWAVGIDGVPDMNTCSDNIKDIHQKIAVLKRLIADHLRRHPEE